MTTLFRLLPDDLTQEIHQWLDHRFAYERTGEMTNAQFYHKTQMHALAPFKKAMWNLPRGVIQDISCDWERQFDQLFNRLGCANTRQMVEKVVKPVVIQPTLDSIDENPSDSHHVNGLVG
jgi:hypothetical protein